MPGAPPTRANHHRHRPEQRERVKCPAVAISYLSSRTILKSCKFKLYVPMASRAAFVMSTPKSGQLSATASNPTCATLPCSSSIPPWSSSPLYTLSMWYLADLCNNFYSISYNISLLFIFTVRKYQQEAFELVYSLSDLQTCPKEIEEKWSTFGQK
jgi:hypothetical protein